MEMLKGWRLMLVAITGHFLLGYGLYTGTIGGEFVIAGMGIIWGTLGYKENLESKNLNNGVNK